MASSTFIPINGFSNSYVIKGNKAIIIDTGILGQHKKILAKLQANGIHDEVSLIILTQCHVDHYGCLKYGNQCNKKHSNPSSRSLRLDLK